MNIYLQQPIPRGGGGGGDHQQKTGEGPSAFIPLVFNF